MPDYSFSTPTPIALVVKNLGGKVTIQATDDGTTNVVLSGAHAEDSSVTQVGDEITVLAPHFDWLEGGWMRTWFRRNRIDITITAPTSSSIELSLGGGETQVIGKFGRVDIRPGAGDVHMTNAAGKTSVRLGAGNVTIDSITDETRVVNGAGKIQVGSIAGLAQLQLATGDVTVGAVLAPVAIKSGAGSIKVGTVTSDLTVDTGMGGATIDRISSGRFTYKGTGGDIKIGVQTGTPTWTEMSTVVGRVSNALPSVGEPKPGQDHVELRITTVSGGIQLYPV